VLGLQTALHPPPPTPLEVASAEHALADALVQQAQAQAREQAGMNNRRGGQLSRWWHNRGNRAASGAPEQAMAGRPPVPGAASPSGGRGVTVLPAGQTTQEATRPLEIGGYRGTVFIATGPPLAWWPPRIVLPPPGGCPFSSPPRQNEPWQSSSGYY
jgi:hypothetical protein